jgi:hypothetical protein
MTVALKKSRAIPDEEEGERSPIFGDYIVYVRSEDDTVSALRVRARDCDCSLGSVERWCETMSGKIGWEWVEGGEGGREGGREGGGEGDAAVSEKGSMPITYHLVPSVLYIHTHTLQCGFLLCLCLYLFSPEED